MVEIISFLVVLVLSLLITRIATVALALTGLSRDSARFQARSAFTGVGFTTSESESVVQHPVRRRILMVLMLMGNAGIVSMVSLLIVSIMNPSNTGSTMGRVGLLMAGLVALWFLTTSKWVDRSLARLIEAALRKWTTLNVYDFANLLHLSGEYSVTESKVTENSWLANKTIRELNLSEVGVLVLGIMKPQGEYVGAPTAASLIEPEDTLILYGTEDSVTEVCTKEISSAE
jgi:K+/H+ antiporter YhaU regulatory subunit KhtT